VYTICRESLNGGLFGRPTTDGKAIFIDLIDVGREGVTGFGWLSVESVMNTAINMNSFKCFFNLCGVREDVRHREPLRCCFCLG